MQPPWTTLVRRWAYRNPWIGVREDVVRRPDGSLGIYGVVAIPDSVFVVARTPAGAVWLVEQWRYPLGRWVWELPAGSCDGEDPAAAARRELAEELGLAAARWTRLGSLRPTCAGLSPDRVSVFLAEELTEVPRTAEPDEAIRAARAVPVAELAGMLLRGELTDVQSVAALALYAAFRGQAAAGTGSGTAGGPGSGPDGPRGDRSLRST